MEDETPLIPPSNLSPKQLINLIKRPFWAFLLCFITFTTLLTFHFTTQTFRSPPPWVTHPGPTRFEFGSCSGVVNVGPPRKFVMSITEFGGVGDGKTLNTNAFRNAIEFLKRFENLGGSMLVVPKGVWVTGSFNVTSNFTLFLDRGALILGSQDIKEWPIIESLPSYGRGRERLGGRHISLIHGNSVSNVVITGRNGTINGQGEFWWNMWRNRTLEYTRGHLVEFVNSSNIMIYNLTFRNSPFWTIHPVYCRNVLVKQMTILAPLDAPNTDGIDPDSSTEVCIEDCYIESGDDLVAIKSGWDQYGIAISRPSSNIIIRKISGTTPTCSGVGIGSEMSGGISNITIDDITVYNAAAGVRIKTDVGRGGYITNISINCFVVEDVLCKLVFVLFAALGFLLYGGRLFLMLQRFPVESKGRRKKLQEVGYVTTICFTCFLIRCVMMCFNAFDKAADLDVLYHPVLNFIYYLLVEILPSSLVLFILRKLPPKRTALYQPIRSTVTDIYLYT